MVGDLAIVADERAEQRAHVPDAAPSPTPSDDASEPSEAPSPTPELTLEEQVATIIRQVEELRGLEFPVPPDIRYVSPEELFAELDSLIEVDEPDGEDADLRYLAALGMVPPDFSLGKEIEDALTSSIAGFYDPETKELVVRTTSGGEPLPPFDAFILAHELEHALADAVIGLPDLTTFGPGEGDAFLAAQSVIEGNATLLSTQWLLESDVDLAAFSAIAQEESEALGDPLPPALEHVFAFPYQEGAFFSSEVFAREGWAGLDAALADPPKTTLEILAPNLRGIDVATPPALGSPGSGWTEDRQDVFGAFDVLALLEAPGGDLDAGIEQALTFASTWRGGVTRQWTDGDQRTTVAVSVTGSGELDLCQAFVRWYDRAFGDDERLPGDGTRAATFDGPDQDMVLVCDGNDVRFAVAPDDRTSARAIGL